MNYEFDRIDLICLGVSAVFGVWYVFKKVCRSLFVNEDFCLQNFCAFLVLINNPLFLALDCKQCDRIGICC